MSGLVCGVVGLMEECREKEGMLLGCLAGMSESGVLGAVVFCASHSTPSLLNSLVFFVQPRANYSTSPGVIPSDNFRIFHRS